MNRVLTHPLLWSALTIAGLYIGFGGHAYLVAIQQGMGKIIGGAVFSGGLVLVVIAGAELFTGNIIMIVSTILSLDMLKKIFRNWTIVYTSNLIGSVLFAYLIFMSGLFGDPETVNALGKTAIKVAEGKMALTFGQAFIRGIFCTFWLSWLSFWRPCQKTLFQRFSAVFSRSCFLLLVDSSIASPTCT